MIVNQANVTPKQNRTCIVSDDVRLFQRLSQCVHMHHFFSLHRKILQICHSSEQQAAVLTFDRKKLVKQTTPGLQMYQIHPNTMYSTYFSFQSSARGAKNIFTHLTDTVSTLSVGGCVYLYLS